VVVEDKNLFVGEGAADWHRGFGVSDWIVAVDHTTDNGFGGAIFIKDFDLAAKFVMYSVCQVRLKILTPDNQLTNA